MFDGYFPEVDSLDERPIKTLCKKGWYEVLLYSMLHILQFDKYQLVIPLQDFNAACDSLVDALACE